MTYATEKLKAGRRLFEVVELDLDACSRVYSIAPCVAVLAPFDLGEASYDGSAFDLDVSGEGAPPRGVALSTSGRKMFVAGQTGDTIFSYTLSDPFDLSTAVYDGASFDLDVSGELAGLQGVTVSGDGRHIYALGLTTTQKVRAYTMATANNLSTATYDGASFDLDVSAQDSGTAGDLVISADGAHLYVVGITAPESVYAYTLSAPHNLSTATYDGSGFDLDVSAQDGTPIGVAISLDGLRLYIVGIVNKKVHAYTFAVAFDLSSATYDGVGDDLDISTEDIAPTAVAVAADGSHLYVAGFTNEKIYSYSFGTGPAKCFNTFATCQDTPNYNKETKTYRFSTPVAGLSRLYDAIPSMRGVATTPTKLDPGRTLGKRAKVSVAFQDHPHHDRGIDKYALERADGTAGTPAYTPFEQGSFFGKLRARNPHYQGRIMRVGTGFMPWDHDLPQIGQATAAESAVTANILFRTYVIEQWKGPDANGAFSIIGKDLLKLAEDSRAECPVRNTGVLDADISNGLLTPVYDGSGDDLDVSARDGLPAGVTISTGGTKMFVLGQTNGKVFSFTLSTAFDLSTASYDGVGKDLDVTARDTVESGIAISADGSRIYILGNNNHIVYSYTMGTPLDLATATHDVGDDLDIDPVAPSARGLAISSDGTKLFVASGDVVGGPRIFSYTMGTPFDQSTATYDGVGSDLHIASRVASILGIAVNNAGTSLYIVESNVGVHAFQLTQSLRIASGVYNEEGFVDTTGEDISMFGIAVASDDTKMYVCGFVGDNVYSYSFTQPFSATLSPAGIGNAEYAASGTLRIGDELMTFTRSGDALTFTQRPTDGTATTIHSAGDVVQECQRWAAVRVDTILQELLEDFANIDSSFIPIADWNTEAAAFLADVIYSVVISEPVGVTALINELTEQSLVVLWWHELDQEFQFKALRTPATELVVTDANTIENTLKQVDVPKGRLTRVTLRYGRINVLQRLDDPTNFLLSHVSVDAGAETTDEFGDIRHRIINSRWLSSGDAALAQESADGILARYVDMPSEFSFALGVKDASIWTGSIIEVQSRYRQDTFGAVGSQIAQVTEVREQRDGSFAYKAISI